MKANKRQKLCCNCEGSVDIDVIVCPYCAADLREEKPEQQHPSFHPNAAPRNLNHQQTMQSLYPPPYPLKTEEAAAESTTPPSAPEETKNIFTPTLLFTLGVQLFLFGLLLFFFSHKGIVLLKWDARLWFLYLFASVPFLVFGYKALSKL